MKSRLPAVWVVGALLGAIVLPDLAAAPNITVARTENRITISGDKARKVASDKFALRKDSWYVIRIAYTGPAVSVCQLSLVKQQMIADKSTISGLLTNWMGPRTTEIIRAKGRFDSDDYMVYVEDAGGPWTIEITENPKPAPLAGSTTFSGTTDKVSPFFSLRSGTASFTIHQALKGSFSPRIQVTLFNGDTGAFVTNLCRNSTAPEQTATAEIAAPGAYVLEVIGGDAWDVSFSQ